MFLTEKKLARRIRELDEYRYRDPMELAPMTFRRDDRGEERLVTVGDTWSGRDAYATVSATVTIPTSWRGRRVVGLFDFGRTGGGNNSGFESLLYIDGESYQGVDANHTEVIFPEDAAGRSLALRFDLWSGLEGGGPPGEQHLRFKRADVAWLDPATDDLYWTARAVLETIQVLGSADAIGVQLQHLLDDTFRLIDWRDPGSPAFYASVSAAREALDQGLARMPAPKAGRITVVGHSHIDVAWLWRLRHTREKAARSFATALRLMDLFPEFVFVQSQPQLYEFVKEDHPGLYARIREHVARGQWEPEGAMWLEADTNLPAGESLVRQVLFGTRFFEQEFGRRCTVLWLPDAFGYSASLPQILKQAGITTFVTTKLSWNQYNRMSHDTFIWRGIDGSEVVAHCLTTPEPEDWNRDDRWFATYNGVVAAGTVVGSWRRYQDRDINDDILMAIGHGDGGGGVTREMLEMRRRLDRIPGLPRVTTGSVADYCRRLQDTLRTQNRYVHTWDGELYLEYHRGTYTSQAAVKAQNRHTELALRDAEWLAAWAFADGVDRWRGAQRRLNQAWKLLLRNQFHDILPGSSIHEVYEDARKDYERASSLIDAVRAEALGVLVDDARDRLTVFNSAPWTRSGIVTVPVPSEPGVWKDSRGHAVASQVVGDALWLYVSDAPNMGGRVLQWHRGASGEGQASPFEWDGQRRTLVTPFYTVAWNDHGHIVRLFDRRAQREVLPMGGEANVLEVFEDKPLSFDAWDVDLFHQEKRYVIDTLESVDLVSSGPVAAVLRFRWTYPGATVAQRVIFYAADPRIDFDTDVDWHTHHQLLKVAFPVDVRSPWATYAIQFGHLTRPTHWNTPWDQARFEVVGHQWADLSEHGYGVSLANDCKYGYAIKDGVMRLSLVKSATYPDYAADQGRHHFRYALLPHRGNLVEARAAESAWDLNSPLVAVSGALVPDTRLIWVDGDHVQIDAVKLAEDADELVVRLHEQAGGRTSVVVACERPIVGWQACDVLERPTGEWREGPMLLELKPFEVRTILVRLAQIFQ